ncbi:MAG: D-alanine--D-alanine ligase family protein [Clostridiaceae bacterium]|nr:D-alanine--D-alanine ligase family protein [Clostridiaceae bacterium]
MAQTVMVLFGGVSTEYLISLRSAFNIIGGLREAGFQVVRVGITPKGEWFRYEGPDEAIPEDKWQAIARAAADMPVPAGLQVRSPRDLIISLCGCVPDCIFPAVHGINCEDGALQGLLTLTGIPYVGCGVLASAAGMDKLHAKIVFRHARIPQCRFTSVSRADIKRNVEKVADQVAAAVGYPCFLKPNNGGSSVGTCRAADRAGLIAALREVSQYDRNVVIEEFVRAREIEVAVMGNDKPKAALLGEVATSQQVTYYDYEAKYFMPDGAEVIIPAALDDKTSARIRRYALKAYKALGCAGLSRVDFFISRDNGAVYINEINTLPGFTPISLFPKAFAASGVPLAQLVKRLCRLAIQEREATSRRELI